MQLLAKEARINGSAVENRKDMREVLSLAIRHNIKPIIEKYKLEDIEKIFERLIKNQVRCRAVITFD
ncbi:MAG TPA: hypothetical protein PL110_05820 [Candidatus Eremiobacteraeota bacterium]|nr:MAG: Alcohol dehydrogenase [bacterium ADurb.Bin363]HPZ07611.1 hypothetical protein [Candidatus Eremiobacteraeota bacterium]